MNVKTIIPYNFEPQFDESRLNSIAVKNISDSSDSSSSSSSSSEEDEFDENFIKFMKWCFCDNCIPMPTAKERCCCRKMSSLSEKLEGLP